MGAAQGPAEANAGARYLHDRLLLVRVEGAPGAGQAPDASSWSERYFGTSARTVIRSRILLLWCGDSLLCDHGASWSASRGPRSPLAWLDSRCAHCARSGPTRRSVGNW